MMTIEAALAVPAMPRDAVCKIAKRVAVELATKGT